jgi:hypothetical protein
VNDGFKIDNLTLRLATLAFGAWSFVVYHSAQQLTAEMSAIHQEEQQFKVEALQRIAALETKLADMAKK